MIGSVIDKSGALIKSCLDRVVPKYSDTLQPGSQRSDLRAVGKKAEWAVSERQRLQTLQAKLRTATATLTVLTGLAAQ